MNFEGERALRACERLRLSVMPKPILIPNLGLVDEKEKSEVACIAACMEVKGTATRSYMNSDDDVMSNDDDKERLHARPLPPVAILNRFQVMQQQMDEAVRLCVPRE